MLMQAVSYYLDVRRTAGFAMDTEQKLLSSFARFATERGDTHVRHATAVDWALKGTSPPQRYYRLRMVVVFARFIHAEDDRHEVPALNAVPKLRRQRPTPYIYSREEMHRLLDETGRLGPVGSLRPQTFVTLFGLIAATGMRISEALALRLDDVRQEGLLVRETKFRKSRLVVLHDTTTAALQQYLQRRAAVGGADEHVFISLKGKGLAYPTAITTFLRVARRIGLHPGPGKRGPRLHDMRHSFAVKALESCRRNRVGGIARHMLALSTYLGHARLSDTYWYLQVTPHLSTTIADECAVWFEGGRS